jgi:hypothetical protein
MQIPVQTEVKYLGPYLDQKLTWQKHVKAKRQKLNLKLREMSWLLGTYIKAIHKNQTTTIQVHNSAHMDIWYTVMGLYKTIKHKNNSRLQSKFLRSVTKAPWYVSNFTIHNDTQIPFVIEEIHNLSTI